MKYDKYERLEIGKRVYDGEISKHEAAVQYGISEGSARRYMRDYRIANDLPPRSSERGNFSYSQLAAEHTASTLEDLHSMTKDELIREVVKARVSEARTKKGYSVKGVGADKEFIPLGKKNIK